MLRLNTAMPLVWGKPAVKPLESKPALRFGEIFFYPHRLYQNMFDLMVPTATAQQRRELKAALLDYPSFKTKTTTSEKFVFMRYIRRLNVVYAMQLTGPDRGSWTRMLKKNKFDCSVADLAKAGVSLQDFASQIHEIGVVFLRQKFAKKRVTQIDYRTLWARFQQFRDKNPQLFKSFTPGTGDTITAFNQHHRIRPDKK